MSQDGVEYAVGGPSGFLFLTGIRDLLFFSFWFFKMPRPVRGPTQPPIQWVLWILFLGLKQQTGEVYHTSQSGAKARNVWGCICTPFLFLHGVHRDSIIFTLFQI